MKIDLTTEQFIGKSTWLRVRSALLASLLDQESNALQTARVCVSPGDWEEVLRECQSRPGTTVFQDLQDAQLAVIRVAVLGGWVEVRASAELKDWEMAIQ